MDNTCNKCKGFGFVNKHGLINILFFGIPLLIDLIINTEKQESALFKTCPVCHGNGFKHERQWGR